MNSCTVLIIGIIFVVVGILFAAVSIYLKLTAEGTKDKSLVITVGGFISSAMGFLTILTGALAIFFHNQITKYAFQIAALIYLFILIILTFVFSMMIKPDGGKNKK